MRMTRKGLLLSTVIGGLTAASASAMAQTNINGGGSTLAQPTYSTEFTTYNNPSLTWNYAGVGSGSGQNAFLTPDPTLDGYAAGTPVHFGASDAQLAESQVTAWNSNRASSAGGLIQVPTFGVPITVPWVLSGHVGGIALNENDVCGIFSGKITNWSGVTRQHVTPASPITVVYRSDSSGTTFLFTQHLATQCNAGNSNITFTATKNFASLFGGTPPSNFVGASGSGGVAGTLLTESSGVAYLSPDYTSIAPNSPTTTSLKVANVVNVHNNTGYQPTIANTTLALTHPGPTAQFGTPPTETPGGNPADPVQWVPVIPDPVAGYPIVGYTTWDVAQCYHLRAAVGTNVRNFLADQYNGVFATNIKNGGFVPVPASYNLQIRDVLLGNSSGLNLNIDNVSACTGKAGV